MRLLLCSTYPHLPDLVGGLQTTTDELCLAMIDRGVEPVVLCGLREHGGDADGLPPRADGALGYRVVRVPDPVGALPAVAAALDPAAVIVQSGTTLVPLVIASLDSGLPTAVYLHNVELQQLGGMLAPDPALLYVANSVFTADRMRALCGIDCLVLPPMVLPHRYMAPETGDRVLFVNPTQVKGVEIALALAERHPDIPFTFVESWSLDPRWRDMVLRRIQGLGHVEWLSPTRDMAAVFGRSRLLLMPSVWEEAFGRTAREAQLNGLPVLASDRGALPDTVGEGGLLVDPHAPIAVWAEALRSLYFDQDAWSYRSARAVEHSRDAVLGTMVGLDNLLMRLAMHGAA
jgi:glycosyltransferase involved in cell wall biosynthesis